MKPLVICLLFNVFVGGTLAQSTTCFQQQADHEIHVRLDDGGHTLHAFQTVTYTNNSPDTLRHIWFHLWPNAYQRKTALDRQMREDGTMTHRLRCCHVSVPSFEFSM